MLPLVALLFGLSLAQPAHAYIDPGSGSFMLQMMLAGLLAAVFSAKAYWARLKTTVAARLGHRTRP